MSESPPKRPPVTGERLETAVLEMRQPSFFKRLAAIVWAQAGSVGLLRGNQLPGGKACDDIAAEIAEAVLQGRRQWKDGKTFFGACESAVRSQVDNWKKKAQNAFEWNEVTAAVEDWDESREVVQFPANPTASPDKHIVRDEAMVRREAELLELAGMVERDTLDEAIVTEMMEPGGASSRAEMVEKLKCTGDDYDAAIKRIKRHAQKIVIRRKE
jgi:hypothetical protein